jgi:2',3'-cyclic-nucleotide 2'-phosphodiesterase / 3'-nucleotidase
MNPTMRLFSALAAVFLATGGLSAKTVQITLLATTDLHGNIYPYDYFTAQPAPRGLAKISSLVENARRDNPYSLLLDCGDVIQGAPLESVYQYYVRNGKLPLGLALEAPLPADPMMAAMSAMHYDAMALGNHEFNYGLKNLSKARHDANFPWRSANTRAIPGAGTQPFEEYLVKTVAGVKIAIIGVTTPAIPMWEQKTNYQGYEFLPIRQTLEKLVPRVRAEHRPDLVIVIAHSGLGRELKTGVAEPGQPAGENAMYDVAANVPGIDAIIFGHTHNQLASYDLNGVLLMQPKNWGMSLGRMDFILDDEGGRWSVKSKTSRLIPVTRETPANAAMLEKEQPYQDAAERYLKTPVATAQADLSSTFARVEDTAVLDAIQQVQLAEAKADVSFASAFNTRVRIPAGPVTVRQIAALYLYDNTLFAVEGTGKMVRDALENAARYFLPCIADCSHEPLINRKMAGFNYDMAQGVDYVLDVGKPAGQRIVNLRWHGKPLADDQSLRIAVNNYRAGGSGGYGMFLNAKVLWRSTEEIRDMIVQYYIERKTLPARPDDNWKIVPEAAARELKREALAEAEHGMTQ